MFPYGKTCLDITGVGHGGGGTVLPQSPKTSYLALPYSIFRLLPHAALTFTLFCLVFLCDG